MWQIVETQQWGKGLHLNECSSTSFYVWEIGPRKIKSRSLSRGEKSNQFDSFIVKMELDGRGSKRRSNNDDKTDGRKKSRTSLPPSSSPLNHPFRLPLRLPTNEELLAARKSVKASVKKTLEEVEEELKDLQRNEAEFIYIDSSMNDEDKITSLTQSSELSSLISDVKDTLSSLETISANYTRHQARSFQVRLQEKSLAQAYSGEHRTLGLVPLRLPPFFEHAREVVRSEPALNQLAVSFQQMLAIGISPNEAIGALERSLKSMGEMTVPIYGPLRKMLEKMKVEQPALLVGTAEGIAKALLPGGVLHFYGTRASASKEEKDLFASGRGLASQYKKELEKLHGAAPLDKVKTFGGTHSSSLNKAKLKAINLVETMSHYFSLIGARLLIEMFDEKGAAHPLAVFFTEVTQVDSSLSGVHIKLATAISASEAPAVIKLLGESAFGAGVGIHIDVLKDDIGGYDSFYPFEAIRYTGYLGKDSKIASKNIPRLQRCNLQKEKNTSSKTGEVYKVIHIGRYHNDAGKWRQYKCCWGRLVEAACTAPGKGTGDTGVVMRVKGTHFRNMYLFERAKAGEIRKLLRRLGIQVSGKASISKKQGSTSSPSSSSSSIIIEAANPPSSSPLNPPFRLPHRLPTNEELLAARKSVKASVKKTLEEVEEELKDLQRNEAAATYYDTNMNDEDKITSLTQSSELSSLISDVKDTLSSLETISANYTRHQARSFQVRLQEKSLAQAYSGEHRTLGLVPLRLPPFFEHAREVVRSEPALNQLAVSFQQMLAIGISPNEAIGALERSLKSMGEKTVPINGPLRKQLEKMKVEQPALLVGIAEGIAKALLPGGVLYYYGTRSMASTEEKNLFASGRGLASEFKSELEKLPGAAPLDKVKTLIGQERAGETMINLDEAKEIVRNARNKYSSDNVAGVLRWFDSRVNHDTVKDFTSDKRLTGLDSNAYIAMQSIYRSNNFDLPATRSYLLEKLTVKPAVDPTDNVLKAHLDRSKDVAPKSIVDLNDVKRVIEGAIGISSQDAVTKVLHWYESDIKSHSIKSLFRTNRTLSHKYVACKAFMKMYDACGCDMTKTEAYINAKSIEENPIGGPELDKHKALPPDATLTELKLNFDQASSMLHVEKDTSRYDVVKVLKRFNDKVDCDSIRALIRWRGQGTPAYIALQSIFRAVDYNLDAAIAYLATKSKEKEVPDASDKVLQTHLAAGTGQFLAAKLSAINLVESMSHLYSLIGARLLIKMFDEKGDAHPLAIFFTDITQVDSSLTGVHVKLATAISASEAPAVIKLLGESAFGAGVGIHIDVLKDDIGGYDSFYPFEAIRYTGYPCEAANIASRNTPRLQRCNLQKEKKTSAKTGEVYKVIRIGRYQNSDDKWEKYACCWGRLVEAACTAPGKGTGDTGVVMRVKGTHFRNMLLFERAKAGEISELLKRLGSQVRGEAMQRRKE
jgi:hypothetical protein